MSWHAPLPSPQGTRPWVPSRQAGRAPHPPPAVPRPVPGTVGWPRGPTEPPLALLSSASSFRLPCPRGPCDSRWPHVAPLARRCGRNSSARRPAASGHCSWVTGQPALQTRGTETPRGSHVGTGSPSKSEPVSFQAPEGRCEGDCDSGRWGLQTQRSRVLVGCRLRAKSRARRRLATLPGQGLGATLPFRLADVGFACPARWPQPLWGVSRWQWPCPPT